MDEIKFLSEVKYRVGIFYTDTQVDESLQSMINGCKQYIKTAGVTEVQIISPLMLDVATMWVEASRNGTLNDLIVSPAFISFTLQLKHYTPVEEGGSNETI